MYATTSRSIAFLLLLFCPFAFYGQPGKYIYSRLSVKDGLASNHVNTILQDSRGFMWFGTGGGLQRFDGKKVVMFRSRNNSGEYLPTSSIDQILEDVNHNFWVRYGRNAGIFDPITYRFKKAVIKAPYKIPPNTDLSLWADSRGNVFLLIFGATPLIYKPVTNTFEQDSNFLKVPARRKVLHMLEDRLTKNYWLGTDSGLVVYDIHTRQLHYTGFNTTGYPLLDIKELNAPVTSFFIDKQSRFWITTWGAVNKVYAQRFYCYDFNSKTLLTNVEGLNAHPEYYKELNGFTQQSSGRVWAYGRMMLLEYLPDQKKFEYIRDKYLDDYTLKYDVVYTLYEDKEKNIWAGTDEGVFVFNPDHQPFVNTMLPVNSPLDQTPEVCAFLQTSQNKFIVSSWGFGSYIYDSVFSKSYEIVGKAEAPGERSFFLHWDLLEEKKTGLIWIACQGGRIIIYDPTSKQTKYYKIPIANNSTFRTIIEDKQGNIWLGCQSGAIIKWNSAAGYGKDFVNGFSVIHKMGSHPYKFKLDKEGYLWIGTQMKGLYKINPGTNEIVMHYSSEGPKGKSLSNDFVSDMVFYNDSLLYLGTGGLDLLNTKTGEIKSFTTENGLPAVNIKTLEIDNDKNIWIGLKNSLCRLNPIKKTFTEYSQKDGITETDFNHNATIRLKDGRLLFGTPHNYLCFQPGDFLHTPPPPDVTITDFKLFNTYLPPDSIIRLRKVELNHTQNSITIEFASLSFLQREKTRYYYKLEGLDEDWIKTDHGLFATYNMLAPGNYVFKVVSENPDGLGSKNVTSLPIYIKPPFYRTGWFISIVIAALIAFIYFIHRMKVNQILDMEKVRSRIARDLHDDMGSTLSTINILSVMAKMKLNADHQKTGEYLQKISDNSNRMMEAMDDIVWSINPMNDNMQRISARMREFATGVLEAKNIDCKFRVDEQVKDLKLDMEARRDIFLIFKEAVNNLAKYSQCTTATVDLSIQKNAMIMKIEDDGIGFDYNNADSGNGLTNMKKRAQSLQAKLKIHSEPGKGTAILLKVPLT